MRTRLGRTRAMALTSVVLPVLAGVSVLLIAPRCDRPVGDETDFPLFVLVGKAVCGAGTVLR